MSSTNHAPAEALPLLLHCVRAVMPLFGADAGQVDIVRCPGAPDVSGGHGRLVQLADAEDAPMAIKESLEQGKACILVVPLRRQQQGKAAEVPELHMMASLDLSHVPVTVVLPSSDLQKVKAGGDLEARGRARPWLTIEGQLGEPTPAHYTSVTLLGQRPHGWAGSVHLQLTAQTDRHALADEVTALRTGRSQVSQHGYLRRPPAHSLASLAFDRHHPDLLKRVSAFEDFEQRPITDLFDIISPRPYAQQDVQHFGDKPPGQDWLSVYGIASINASGLTSTDDFAPPDLVGGTRVETGDWVIPRYFIRNRRWGRHYGHVGVVTKDTRPGVIRPALTILRPRQPLEGLEATFVRLFLEHHLPDFAMLHGTSLAGHTSLPASSIRQMQVLWPDQQIKSALREVEESRIALRQWSEEADRIEGGIFRSSPDGLSARSALLESGRTLRARVAAARLIDDDEYLIRTRYPYPIAHRWRVLESLRGSSDVTKTYEAVLEVFEVTMAFCALAGFAAARVNGIPITAQDGLRHKLNGRRSGPTLGDWVSVAQEIGQSKRWRALPDTAPFIQLRNIYGGPDHTTQDACTRLSRRRNDHAHMRKAQGAELHEQLAAAIDDLKTVLTRLSFLADLQLVHVLTTRWKSLEGYADVETRHMVGDHPVVPVERERHRRSDLEAGSLYLKDSDGELHLMRPFLIGERCPTCHTWSTYHVDRVGTDDVTLKSLDHEGHPLRNSDDEFREGLRISGLL